MNFPSFENKFWWKNCGPEQNFPLRLLINATHGVGRVGHVGWVHTSGKCSPLHFPKRKSRNTCVQIPSERLKLKVSIACSLHYSATFSFLLKSRTDVRGKKMKKSERKHLRVKNISVLNITDGKKSSLNLRSSNIIFTSWLKYLRWGQLTFLSDF